MKYHLSKALAAAAGLLVTTGTASAATLITSGITATASSFINGNTAPSKTIDNSGMTGNVHNSTTQTSWMSTDTNDLANEWIQWDLGATFVLDSIQVWNYNDFSRFDSGINQLDIYVSTVASPGDPEIAGAGNGDNWTQIGTNVNLSKGQGVDPSTYTGVDLEADTGVTLPVTAIRWIRFEVDSNYWDGAGPGNLLGPDQAALSEIRFFEADAIPEPSAALLGSLGLLALLRRRRA